MQSRKTLSRSCRTAVVRAFSVFLQTTQEAAVSSRLNFVISYTSQRNTLLYNCFLQLRGHDMAEVLNALKGRNLHWLHFAIQV